MRSLDALHAVLRHGQDAVAFQSLESGQRWWWDGEHAAVAYVPAGSSWIAVGTPLAASDRRDEAVRRFIGAARAAGKRAVFFGVEGLECFRGCRTLPLGLQSRLHAADWDATLQRSRKLREQLRRARAKGVAVRVASPEEVSTGGLRGDVERLRDAWLASRAVEPMAFLVAVEPFHFPHEHVYVVAEREGTPLQFLSAVPIQGGRGWLMEDMLRGAGAPNGTTELVIDAFLRHLGPGPAWVTPGLTPLTGSLPWWLRAARLLTLPLYDFEGLRRFRSRLHPASWRPVWLAWDRGPAVSVMLDVLRAFAGGRLLPFAWRSLVRHPNGPPWAVAVSLLCWTVLLAVLAAAGGSGLVGFSTMALAAWTLFDAAFASLLFRVARRPRRRGLALAAGVCAFDAAISLRHVWAVGPGPTVAHAALRAIASAGPVLGTAALLYARSLSFARTTHR